MSYQQLIKYSTVEEYREHYKEKYCKAPIESFDNLQIYFYEDRFDHAFYESSNYKGSKDIFSIKRAERIDWIERVLKDTTAELFIGYDSLQKNYNNTRRVAIINDDDYVVVIQLTRENRAKFITAYVADSPNSAKNIRSGPIWK